MSAVNWFEGTLDQALERATKDNKQVFLDVGAYWCPPCHQLDEETFVDIAVAEALGQGYVALHIDAEKDEGPMIVERYHVQVYPTLLVLSAAGAELGRLVDFHAPPDLLAGLEQIKQGESPLARAKKEVGDRPDDLDARYQLGHLHAISAQREQAEKHFARVLAGAAGKRDDLVAKILYDRAQFFAHKLDQDRERAIEMYRELQRRFPASKPALRAYRQIGRALHELGRDDEAIASLRAMIAREPNNAGLKESFGWFSFRQRCRPDVGLEVVERGLKAEPDSAGLHYLAGELRLLLKDQPGAVASLRRAAALEPKTTYYQRRLRSVQAGRAG